MIFDQKNGLFLLVGIVNTEKAGHEILFHTSTDVFQ